MYGCESWTIKKAEHRRTDAFELWCGRRILQVPYTANRSNQSVLKEINPEYSLEELMLKLKLQNFGLLMWRANWLKTKKKTKNKKKPCCWERLKAGEGDDWGWDGWMASPTQWTWVWASSRRWWRTGKPGVLQSTGSQRVRHDWVTKQQQPVLQISSGMASLRRGCVNFFLPVDIHSGQGPEQRHFGFHIQPEGLVPWGKSLCMIITTKATKSKSKNTCNLEWELDLPCNTLNSFSILNSTTFSIPSSRGSCCFIEQSFQQIISIITDSPQYTEWGLNSYK